MTPSAALVVDDSKAMRMILSRMLKSLGYTVHQAVDGLDGLNQLRRLEGVSVVLVDWNMPELDGLGFVRAVRADSSFDQVRLLMVSSEADHSRIMTALEAGADEYAMKPFDVETIRAKLELIGRLEPSEAAGTDD